MIAFMDILTEKGYNSKVLVTKELRDEVVEKSNDTIEDKLDERNQISKTIGEIDNTIKVHNIELKKSLKKYRLDKRACKKILKAKIKEAKKIFKQAKKEAKEEYLNALKSFYVPVELEKENISNFKSERSEYIDRLKELKEEIETLQKYKSFIDMKYTSEKKEFVSEKLVPKSLRTK